ncbi:MAG TPA: flavodoxin [Paraburkholderia sp.]|nr:flavodoxin [Paraburkholderia sp.]
MSDARILVVFYSRSGTTRKLASAIAESLGADLEEICDYSDRRSVGGYVRSLLDAIGKRCVDIVPGGRDVATYDLVVIGTPVWAGMPCAPVRAWILGNKGQLRHIAAFCSLGGRGSATTFEEVSRLAGRTPLARCKVTGRDIRQRNERALIRDFVAALKRKAATFDEVEWMS